LLVAFDELDIDEDGFISKEELTTALRKSGVPEEFLETFSRSFVSLNTLLDFTTTHFVLFSTSVVNLALNIFLIDPPV
jgi:hypothetical protein